MSRTHLLRILALVLTLSGASACQAPDPYLAKPQWSFSGANNANLAAMLDNPGDLVHGQSDRRAGGQTAVIPVMRLQRDQVKQLPSSDTTQIIGSGGGGNSAQGAGLPAEVQ